MKNFILAIASVLICVAFKADRIKISPKDFKPAFGDWKGSLTYLDYKSGKPYTMPANVSIVPSEENSHQIILVYKYPNEPKANGNDTLTFDMENSMLNKGTVTIKKELADNTLEIITEERDEDGNDHKAAILKRTYIIGKKVFSIRKDVQFVSETTWIQRDIYSFLR